MNQDPIQSSNSTEVRAVLHDLSNTITGVLMNAGLLSLALRGNQNLRRYADDIQDGASRAASILQQARCVLEGATGTPAGTITDDCDQEHTVGHHCLRHNGCNCTTRTQ